MEWVYNSLGTRVSPNRVPFLFSLVGDFCQLWTQISTNSDILLNILSNDAIGLFFACRK